MVAASCGGGSGTDGEDTAAGRGVTLGAGGPGFSVPGAARTGPDPGPAVVRPSSAGGALLVGGSDPALPSVDTPSGSVAAPDPGTDASSQGDPPPTNLPPSGTSTQAPLEELLLSAVSGAFVLQPEGESETGPIDLARAVDDDGDDDAAAFLTQQGFLQGYQRDWYKGEADAEVTARLYRFQAAGGAQAYLERVVKSMSQVSTGAGVHTETSPVDGVPGAMMVTATEGSYRSAVVVFARGVHFSGMVVSDDGSFNSSQLGQDLARRQYGRL